MRIPFVLVLSLLVASHPITLQAACGGIVGEWTDSFGIEWTISQDGSGNLTGTMRHNGFVGNNPGDCPEVFDMTGSINVSTGEFQLDVVYAPEEPLPYENCGPFSTHFKGTVNLPGCENAEGVWVIIPDVVEDPWEMNRDCAIPTGESTTSSSWSTASGYETAHDWIQTLTTSSGDRFAGRTVMETDPGGGGPDTCWFSGSLVPQQLSVTGGSWLVGSQNQWGPDTVGWLASGVTYYRNQSRAPCTTTIPQVMKIQCDAGYVTYESHSLIMGIGTTTVSSTRDGQFVQKSWP